MKKEYEILDQEFDNQDDIEILHNEAEMDDWSLPIIIHQTTIEHLKQPR